MSKWCQKNALPSFSLPGFPSIHAFCQKLSQKPLSFTSQSGNGEGEKWGGTFPSCSHCCLSCCWTSKPTSSPRHSLPWNLPMAGAAVAEWKGRDFNLMLKCCKLPPVALTHCLRASQEEGHRGLGSWPFQEQLPWQRLKGGTSFEK